MIISVYSTFLILNITNGLPLLRLLRKEILLQSNMKLQTKQIFFSPRLMHSLLIYQKQQLLLMLRSVFKEHLRLIPRR